MRCGTQRTRNHSVSIAALNHEASEIKGIAHNVACLVNRHTLAFAQFRKKLGIGFRKLHVVGVGECGFLDMWQSKLKSLGENFIAFANQDNICDSL